MANRELAMPVQPGVPANPGLLAIVEDNPDDAFLMKRYLEKAGVRQRIELFGCNEDFARTVQHAKDKFDLIILTLATRTEAPLDFLRWVREQQSLAGALVLAVGNSTRAHDIQAALDLGANAYYAKGIDFAELASTVLSLEFIR